MNKNFENKSIENIQTIISEKIQKNNKVRSNEYLDWLVDFIKKYEMISDEDILYNDKLNEFDKENGILISVFFNYIQELAKKQNIFSIENDYEISYYFVLRGNRYKITTFVGQGAVTYIAPIDENNQSYVYVDTISDKKDLINRELVQYIVINKDYIGKIDSAKFGVHIGHVCTICAINEFGSEKFNHWYQNGSMQKKIILVAKTKKLEELERNKNFYSVRDLGFTEVENGTLLAVSLGIMTREEAKLYIKGLQLWKDKKGE